MEELQSTEILEREILDDARKKAQRILKVADDTISAKTAEWEKKTAKTISELQDKYDKQKKTETEKTMARLPIDKLRTKVEKIESLLITAEEIWFKALSRPQVCGLLENELSKRVDICEDVDFSSIGYAYYNGLERREIQTLLKNLNITCETEEIASADFYPAIVLESENVRVTASIQKMLDSLLQNKREELIEALVGSAYMREA